MPPCVVGVTFNDLRGTAVTRLAMAGCTEAEIATITGHSLRGVRAILDTHYLSRRLIGRLIVVGLSMTLAMMAEALAP